MLATAMKYIIKDVALMQFTWKGTLKKKAFMQFTNINSAIQTAVSSVFSEYNEYAHNHHMIMYLKHSTTRFNQLMKKNHSYSRNHQDEIKINKTINEISCPSFIEK